VAFWNIAGLGKDRVLGKVGNLEYDEVNGDVNRRKSEGMIKKRLDKGKSGCGKKEK